MKCLYSLRIYWGGTVLDQRDTLLLEKLVTFGENTITI